MFVNRSTHEAPISGTGQRVILAALQQSREREKKKSGSNVIQAYCPPKGVLVKDVCSGPEFRAQFLGHLLDIYLPATKSHITHSEHQRVSFVHYVPDLINSSSVLDSAFDAFSVMVLYHARHDERLGKECLLLHATALRELQNAISTPKLRTTNETLGAISFLSLYQVCVYHDVDV